MIVISPFSRGGKVVHSYNDHASVVKFIERNWDLKPLTDRSRDNLPNPKMDSGNPYVPVNMPAVGVCSTCSGSTVTTTGTITAGSKI